MTRQCATPACSRPAAPGRRICYTCKTARFRLAHPDYHPAYQRAHPQRPSEASRRRTARWREKPDVAERLQQYRRDRQQALKMQVITSYGGACACCDEREPIFLTIDHINGDGAEHRRVVSPGAFYGWLIKQGFPEGFQVLCFNCNWAKSHGGCPHVPARRANT